MTAGYLERSGLFLQKCGFDKGPGKYFITQREVRYYCVMINSVISVPAGFPTDFDSVPSLFLWLIQPNREQVFAAVIHDFLYGCKGEFLDAKDNLHKLTRRQCDLIYLEALRAEGFAVDDAWLSYFGLRIGGWWGWNVSPWLHRKNIKIGPTAHKQSTVAPHLKDKIH